MTTRAVLVEKQAAFMHNLRRSFSGDGRRGWVLVAERGRFQGRRAAQRERENSSKSRLDGAERGIVIESDGSTPTRHHRNILDSVDPVRNGRGHDSGAGVERPQ